MNVCEFDNIAREVFAPIYPVIAEQIKQKTGITTGKCLDIGCGGGYLGIALASITELYIYLLDKSLEMLEIAASNISAAGLKTRMQTFFADVKKIPLPDQSINLIISRGSIFFWEDQQKAFEEIYRVLAPGGVAYIGGGFGSAELKKQIAARMEKDNKNWRAMMNKNIGENAPEAFTKILQNTKIAFFEINRDEAGLWILIRRRRDEM
ncbi:methylase involved in ubiquinone/menaquinone biosynthesis [Desulfoscipio gibsoniae DSM 7213]|uniref:Methylase involved in ubiquinone/menaquinone biosynthesis n=2 Tax=Desulfoscipio gibsoniae TaxID=102134 RepID=R4KNF4_9FIRM|nr:methylase involved in ubiquinone/menaquinone biosynthesis [Desulfoscipio gibsoniae DSM 7213]